MIAPHEEGWIDECWGRIVIAIGQGIGKQELEVILNDLSQVRWEDGVKDEVDRRTNEIAERLMGKNRICVFCNEVFEPKKFHGGPYYCEKCEEPIPF